MAISYAQARRDFETLTAYAELEDEVELDAMRLDLMRNPTKEEAAKMYIASINLWFCEHNGRNYGVAVTEIADRHNINL